MQHPSIANVRIEGDRQRGQLFVPDAEKLLWKLQEMLRAGSVTSGGLAATLGDGVFAYVRVADGLNVIQIVADSELDQESAWVTTRSTIPDFYSGMVRGGRIDERTERDGRKLKWLRSFKPTKITYRENGPTPSNRGKTKLTTTDWQEVTRLAVTPHATLSGAHGQEIRAFTESQYTRLRPTMYSGSMKKLVQFILGYGRIPERTIYGIDYKTYPEGKESPEETAPPSPYEKEISSNGVQVRYDFRWLRTHGLTRSSDNKWWVVEISNQGIFAIPLVLYDKTTTDAFREKVADMGDDEAMEVLETFGGFPTGESIPSRSNVREAYVRAGFILSAKPEALQRYYSGSMYSSAMGWAFSESGRRADNTGWRSPDLFTAFSHHYSCSMDIGPLKELEKSSAGATLKTYLMAAKDKRDRVFDDLIGALFIKCERLDAKDVGKYLKMKPEEAFDALNELVMPPIAEFSFNCAMVSEAQNGGVIPEMKFYEPLVSGLVSVDYRPARRPGLVNAMMHVFYQGETMKWVRFYQGPSETVNEFEGERQECHPRDQPYVYPVGQSTLQWRSGFKGYPCRIYTSEYDDRSLEFETVTTEVWNGSRMPTPEYYYSADPAFPVRGYLIRSWSFRLTFTRNTSSSRYKRSAAAVPGGMREAYHYALLEGEGGSSKSSGGLYASFGDPYGYETFDSVVTYNINFPPGCRSMSCARLPSLPDCGRVLHPTVVREDEPYFGPCSDLTDQGPWAERCDVITKFGIDVPENFAWGSLGTSIPKPAIPTTSETGPSKATLKVWFVYSGEFSPIKTYEKTETGSNAGFLGWNWFDISPDDLGFYDFTFAYGNAFGTGDTVMFSPTVNTGFADVDGFTWHRGQPFSQDMKDGIVFIGVINEQSL